MQSLYYLAINYLNTPFFLNSRNDALLEHFVNSGVLTILVMQQWFKMTGTLLHANSTLLNPTSTILAYITDALIIYSNRTHKLCNTTDSTSIQATSQEFLGRTLQQCTHSVIVFQQRFVQKSNLWLFEHTKASISKQRTLITSGYY